MTTARRPADGTVGIGILGTGGIVRRSFVPAVKATPGPNDPFREEIEDFVRAIRTGGPPSAGLDDGLLNVRILERALVT